MKRSYQSCEIGSELVNQIKKKKGLDLAEYDTDEQLIPIKYQGEWKIAGGKYKMGDTERREMKEGTEVTGSGLIHSTQNSSQILVQSIVRNPRMQLLADGTVMMEVHQKLNPTFFKLNDTF